jgi:hypothetical protein
MQQVVGAHKACNMAWEWLIFSRCDLWLPDVNHTTVHPFLQPLQLPAAGYSLSQTASVMPHAGETTAAQARAQVAETLLEGLRVQLSEASAEREELSASHERMSDRLATEMSAREEAAQVCRSDALGGNARQQSAGQQPDIHALGSQGGMHAVLPQEQPVSID